MQNRTVFVLGTLVVPLAILGAVAVFAGSVTIPNTFTANTPALAAEVNANFAAVAVAVNDNDARITAQPAPPQVWAQIDSDSGGTNNAGVGLKEINSVAINAPSAGVLVISGQVYISSGEVTSISYVLRPSLDGTPLDEGSFLSQFRAGASPSAGYRFTLNYTIAAPVTAGPHTVAQSAGPVSGTANWFNNREYLTVLFVPTGSVADLASLKPSLGGGPYESDPSGE